MFEVGKKYEVELSEAPGDRSYIRGELLAHEGTLIKLQVGSAVRILNTAAPSFIGAQEYRTPAPGSIYAPGPAPTKPAA